MRCILSGSAFSGRLEGRRTTVMVHPATQTRLPIDTPRRRSRPVARRQDVARQRDGMVDPERWLVVLRITVGAWFLKAVVTKLAIIWWAALVPLPIVSPRFLGV